MGWLKELMRQARPAVPSLGELARATLAEPVWGDAKKPHPRSLAALFSKLDRGIELEWLADRQAVQFALARVLGCTSDEIRGAVGATLGDAGRRTRRFRFDEARFARPLDLLDEDLPPGLPGLLLQPTAWARVWWHAPSGSGRSLVGSWLEARGRAAHVDARTFGDAARRFPKTGPVFCELHARSAVPEDLARSQICVAAPFLPDGGPWLIVESPAPSNVLPELLHWLERRLPRDGQFRAEEAVALLADTPGLVSTLGDVIGIVGMLDEHGVRAFEGKTRRFVAERYVDSRLKLAALDGNADAAWLRKRGFETIVGLGRRAMLETDVPIDAPRSEDEWLDLVPPELQPGVDREWLRASLTRNAAPRTARDLERALEALPPGAFRVVRALTQSGLLREGEHRGGKSLTPGWLRNAVAQEATAQVCRSSPLEWGAGLLRAHSECEVARGVQVAFATDALSMIDEVLDQLDPESPASVAAFEMIFRLAGLGALHTSSVGTEALRLLFREQQSLLVKTSGGFWPRIRYEAAAQVPLLRDGAWQLAWLACVTQGWLSAEELGKCLAPLEALVTPALKTLLDGLEGALETQLEGSDAWRGAVRVLETLRAFLGARAEADHAVFAICSFRAGVAADSLGWPCIEQLARQAPLLLGVRRELGTRWPTAVALGWRSWHDAGCPPAAAVLGALGKGTGPWEALLPETVLEDVLANRPEALLELSLTDLGEGSWLRISAHWDQLPERVRRRLTESMPEDVAVAGINAGHLGRGRADVERLWLRFAPRFQEHVRSVAPQDLDLALTLAEQSGALDVAPLVAAFRAGLGTRGATPRAIERLRSWLSACIARRGSGWLSAYALLDELEAQEQRLEGI